MDVSCCLGAARVLVTRKAATHIPKKSNTLVPDRMAVEEHILIAWHHMIKSLIPDIKYSIFEGAREARHKVVN